MKKIFIIIGLFLIQNIAIMADEEVYPIEKKTLKFDADNDKKIDTIYYSFQKFNHRNATVKIKIEPTKADPIQFETETYVNFEISSCSNGCIKIENRDWGRWSEGEVKYYRYSPQKRSWFLEKAIYDYPHFNKGENIPSLQRDIEHLSYDMSQRIDEKVIPTLSKRPLATLEQKSKKMSNRFSNSINIEYIQYYLDRFPLSKKTVTYYNNIAYYLDKKEKEDLAIFLLEKIIKKFPTRVVAYLNLGDAYYKTEDNRFKKMYKRYIELMKKKEKYNKIPKRVFKRLPNHK
jgi:hypothetical protein